VTIQPGQQIIRQPVGRVDSDRVAEGREGADQS